MRERCSNLLGGLQCELERDHAGVHRDSGMRWTDADSRHDHPLNRNRRSLGASVQQENQEKP